MRVWDVSLEAVGGQQAAREPQGTDWAESPEKTSVQAGPVSREEPWVPDQHWPPGSCVSPQSLSFLWSRKRSPLTPTWRSEGVSYPELALRGVYMGQALSYIY